MDLSDTEPPGELTGQPPPDRSDIEGLARFRFALRRFLAFSEAASRSAGITNQQYQAMLAIKAHPGEAMAIKDLAEQMLVVPNGAVQLVDRLENQKLVQRSEAPADRRSVLVRLTAAGDALLLRLAAEHMVELARRKPLLAESLRHLRDLGK